MAPTVGFIMVTYNKPHQILRLVTTLNRMFDRPPIVSHHDFSKCDLPLATFPENFAVVRPHEITGWGIFSVVEGMLRALKLMYESPNPPDWFMLISAADYPIKPADRILSDLVTGDYDAYIDYEEVVYNQGREWLRTCYERYCVAKFRLTYPNRKLGLTKRTITLKNPLLAQPFVPFSKNLRCFAGSHWFSANRQAAEYLLEFHRTKTALADHYRWLESCGDMKSYNQLVIPDESYYQTVLCNAPNLKVQNKDFRYIDWSSPIPGDRPKTLLMADLPDLLNSPAHFARKFDIDRDAQILDELDKVIGL